MRTFLFKMGPTGKRRTIWKFRGESSLHKTERAARTKRGEFLLRLRKTHGPAHSLCDRLQLRTRSGKEFPNKNTKFGIVNQMCAGRGRISDEVWERIQKVATEPATISESRPKTKSVRHRAPKHPQQPESDESMTAKDVATFYGVRLNTARAYVRKYCRKTGRRPQPPGLGGRPSILFDKGDVEFLAARKSWNE